MKSVFALSPALAVSGCASFEKTFANRIVFTADGKSAMVNSMYGPLGIASKVDPEDAKAMIEAAKKK